MRIHITTGTKERFDQYLMPHVRQLPLPITIRIFFRMHTTIRLTHYISRVFLCRRRIPIIFMLWEIWNGLL